MKKTELIKLIKETVEEARVAGQVQTRPGYKKVYRKGEGWIWVKKDDVMPGSTASPEETESENESETLERIKGKIAGIIASLDTGEEDFKYSYKGVVNYYSPISKQWNTLPLNDTLRKNPVSIVAQLLQKTNTKEIEIPISVQDNFKRAEELFDEFKGKSSNIFAYPNTRDEVTSDGKPTLLRFTNNIVSAKKDLIAFDKFNKIQGDDTLSGLKVDGEEEPLDVDKELNPSFSRKGANVGDEASFDDVYMSAVSDQPDSYSGHVREQLKKAIKSLIKEVKSEQK